MKHFFRYKFPAIFWAILIYVASSIPSTKLPKFIFHINDKLIHVSIFFVLGLLFYNAMQPRSKPAGFQWNRLLISVIAVIVYGISDELHQGFVPGRTVDIIDATADSIGGILAAIVIYTSVKMRQTNAHTEGS